MLIKCPVCGAQYELGPGRYQCLCGIKFCIDLKENVSSEDPSASAGGATVVLRAPVASKGGPLRGSAGRGSGRKRIRLDAPGYGVGSGFAVGDVIMGRYKVFAELGRGGACAVYRCFDETTGLEVALKTLPPELSHNAAEMEEIRKNFRMVRGLLHPNIAAVGNLEKDPVTGDHYLIMEYVEGENLRQWLERKRRDGALTPENIFPVVRQIAEALDCAHEREIFHRDLKPGNIMITPEGQVKVLDFGLSAQIRIGLTRIGAECRETDGMRPYLAPEQWRGLAAGTATEQYTLGVLVYEMLSGRLPFERTDPEALRQAVMNEAPEPLAGVSSCIQQAVRRAMSRLPAERFPSCTAFADALEETADPNVGRGRIGPGAHVGPGLRNGPGSRIGPRELRIAAGAVIAVVLLAVIGYGYRRYVETRRIAEERRVAEEKHLAEEKARKEAEERRIAEEKRLVAAERARQEAEEKRIAEEKARKEAEERRAAEEKRLAAERARQEAEEKRIAEEKRRIESWKKRLSIDTGKGFVFSKDGTILQSTPKNITGYEIPNGVTGIGAAAFRGCRSLQMVTIPSSVAKIGDEAFRDCNSLSGVTIPSGVTEIGAGAFSGCSSLTSVTISQGVAKIGDAAFRGCNSLTTMTIPPSVTDIGSSAFEDCISLQHVTIPPGVTRIGDRAFQWCISLESAEIPPGVTGIGGNVFSGCRSLRSVTIPSGVAKIGDGAFSGCRSLRSVTIPSEVTSIGRDAFSGCDSLQSVTIPSRVVGIGEQAFSGVGSVFSDNAKFPVDKSGVLVDDEKKRLLYVPLSLAGHYSIPAGIAEIGDAVFSGCRSLQSVTIPSSVTGIGNRAFSGCSSLQSVTIPSGVTGIGAHAFSSCSALKSVTIPSSVTRIGSKAFGYCFSLRSVTITPAKIIRIERDAFSGAGCEAQVKRDYPHLFR